MFCKLNSYSLNGINALPIEVEIDLQTGLPGFDIVGLPDSSVKEAKERVKSAIKNSGFPFPICHIVVNLAPADIRKEGSLYDLPIALGILCCLGVIPLAALEGKLFIGELALDGTLRGVRGVLPILCALPPSYLTPILPVANAHEASILKRCQPLFTHHLKEIVAFLKGEASLINNPTSEHTLKPYTTSLDYGDVKGQERAKHALMLTAAGHHHTLLIGPPGSGKTMLAQRLPTIMSPLSEEEAIEITKIYSVANQLPQEGLMTQRPFRAPHHTISSYGLAGGGIHPKPGEISLAHLGVLFLDELLEFNSRSLEILRQPLESQTITLSRVHAATTYPAHFLFLAATNPCPCGYYPDLTKCTCSIHQIKRYLGKLSGPLLDRIDIQLELQVPSIEQFQTTPCLSSKEMRERVLEAQARQKKRYQDTTILFNSQLTASQVHQYCKLTSEASDLLHQWFHQKNASLRAYDKVLRLALTMTDLEGLSIIGPAQIASAIHYRSLDYPFWS